MQIIDSSLCNVRFVAMEKNLEHEATTKMDLPDLLTTMKRVYPDFEQDCHDVDKVEAKEYVAYMRNHPTANTYAKFTKVRRRPSVLSKCLEGLHFVLVVFAERWTRSFLHKVDTPDGGWLAFRGGSFSPT